MTSGWIAYVDESMRVGAKAYILAAACLEVEQCKEARHAVASLTKPGHRFHWRQSSAPMKHKAVSVVTGLPALHLVVVAAPMDPRRQERARRHCLRRLLFELDRAGVSRVLMEARESRLNMRDLQAVNVLRIQGVIGPDIVVEHGYPGGPAGEPLLWVPDIVAGAIGGEPDGGEALTSGLSSVVTRYDIELD